MYVRWSAFIIKKGQIFCLWTWLWIALALGEHFHFQNNELDDILVHDMQPNYSFLFIPKVVHILWRHVCKVLNAINTDFKLYVKKVSATVHNKLPQHLTVCNIAQHLKENTWTNMEMTSFAPEKFLKRPNWCPHIHRGKVNFPFITWLELPSV